ncbi:hypothetical protein CCP3SC15_330003 [Gammaproteobacteria bacterium]
MSTPNPFPNTEKLPPDIDLYMLPETARDLVRAVGLAVAIELVASLGGTRISAKKIERGFSRAVANQFRSFFWDGEVEVPRCLSALRAAHARMILADEKSGVGNKELALKYGYTERGIRKLRAREHNKRFKARQMELFPGDPRQIDMF